jgi:hypothetical protein
MSGRPPLAAVAHRRVGRARLRFLDQRNHAAFFRTLAGRLSLLPTVSRVDARPLTGSVIIYYRGSWPAFAESVERAGLFVIERGKAESAGAARALPVTAQASLALAGGHLALAAWQLARGRTLPPALTLVWYAGMLVQPLIGTLIKE